MGTRVSLFVKEARRRSGFSQLKLGELVGVSRDTIRRWENGVSEPVMEQIEKIQEATGHAYNGASLYRYRTRQIPVISMRTPACAGGGNGLDCIELDTERTTDVDDNLFTTFDESRKPFAVYVDGDSMEEMDICDGDIAVINPAEMPLDGECALISYKGRWSIKGIFWNRDGSVTLKAGKPQYDMVISKEEAEDENWFKVIGKVILSRSERKPKRF